jgi:hypothetical protein
MASCYWVAVTSATEPLDAPDDATVRDDLRRKLTWMRRVRLDAAAGAAPDRADLQALAAAFPGALRELDDNPLEAIEARAADLDAPGPLPAWARVTWLYHAALRRDLEATRRGERPRGALVERAIAEVARTLGVPPEEVEALALPHARRRRRRT